MNLRKVMNNYSHHISLIVTATTFGGILSVFWFTYDRGCLDTQDNLNSTLFAASIFSVFGFLLLSSFNQPGDQRKLAYIFHTLNRYALAILIFQYAMPQVHGVGLNLNYFSLEEKVVNYSPKQFLYLYYSYNPIFPRIVGWMLMVSALALSFRKTTLIGAFMLAPIFAHMLMLNFIFEFCHVLDISLFLASTLVVMLYYRKRILALFMNRPISEPKVYPIFEKMDRTYRGLAILKFILIIGYLSFLNNEKFAQTQGWWFRDSPIVQGVWSVDTLQAQKDTVPRFEKFFFEKGRFGIATVEDDTISGFQYIIDTSYNQLEFWNFHEYRELDFKGKYELVNEDTLIYKGTNQKDSIYMLLSRVPEFDRIKGEVE